MIRHLRSLCLMAALAFTALVTFGQNQDFHVLAFHSMHVEQDHMDFTKQAIPFFEEMARRDHFDFKATTNWDDLNPTVLKQYQVVLWLDEFPLHLRSDWPFRITWNMEGLGWASILLGTWTAAKLGHGSPTFSERSSTAIVGPRCRSR